MSTPAHHLPASPTPPLVEVSGEPASLVGKGLYDLVLHLGLMETLFEANGGWKLSITPDEATRAKLDRCRAVRVSPIGKFNVGKTWVIQRLCAMGAAQLSDLKLPSGDAFHTEGASIKICNAGGPVINGGEGTMCVFLDTAGLNSPMTSIKSLGKILGSVKALGKHATAADKQRAMILVMEEQKRQEMFLRNVAFDFGQVFLLVVGQVSYEDQMEMLRVLQHVERNDHPDSDAAASKQVIVIHNLRMMSAAELNTPIVRSNGKATT